jgi:hypothetical protein
MAVVNTASSEVVGMIDLSTDVFNESAGFPVAVSEKLNRVYVINNGATYAVVDGGTHQILSQVELTPSPTSLAVDDINDLVFVGGGGVLHTFGSRSTGGPSFRRSQLPGPIRAVAVDPVLRRVYITAGDVTGWLFALPEDPLFLNVGGVTELGDAPSGVVTDPASHRVFAVETRWHSSDSGSVVRIGECVLDESLCLWS